MFDVIHCKTEPPAQHERIPTFLHVFAYDTHFVYRRSLSTLYPHIVRYCEASTQIDARFA